MVLAESGIPVFRDKLVGLREKFDPAVLATTATFRHYPALVRGRYEWRRLTGQRARPSAADGALPAVAELVPKLTPVTQNVNDPHERAGKLRTTRSQREEVGQVLDCTANA